MLNWCAIQYNPPPPFSYYSHRCHPGSDALAHVGVTGKNEENRENNSPDTSSVLSIGAGLPPVPLKLVKRIQAGKFIDIMSELLPDRLGINAGPLLDGDKEEKRTKQRQVATYWNGYNACFSIFTAVCTQTYPEKTQDMLGYLALIIEARMEYEGDRWLGYDRRFRQNAAASPDATWARIDPTLWNMAFVGQAKVYRCKHCFSLTHAAADCNWAPSPSTFQAAYVKANEHLPATKNLLRVEPFTIHLCQLAPSQLVNTSMFAGTAARTPKPADISHKAMFYQQRRPLDTHLLCSLLTQPHPQTHTRDTARTDWRVGIRRRLAICSGASRHRCKLSY